MNPANVPICHLLFTVSAFSASAYASDRPFKTEQDFSDYLVRLGLPTLSIKSATEKLAIEGFNCAPQSDKVICVREARELLCKQKQIARISAQGPQGAEVQISSRLGQVCP